MKRIKITSISITIIISLCIFCGCSQGAEQNEYERLVAENQRLTTENQKLTEELNSIKTDEDSAEGNEPTMVDAKLTGGFVATVRHIIPNYVLDEIPRVAIVTQFQSGPFMLGSANLSEDAIAMLEIGQTYYFEIEDTIVGEIPQEELNTDYVLGQETYPRFFIKSVRPAEENETGLNGPSVVYRSLDN